MADIFLHDASPSADMVLYDTASADESIKMARFDFPGFHEIQVAPPTPTVAGINVYPSSIVLESGATQQFIPEVYGDFGPPQGVTWSTTLGLISLDGLLNAPVATNVNQTGIVTARSTYDSTVKGEAVFAVAAITTVPVDPEPEPPIENPDVPNIFASTIMAYDEIYLSTVMI